MNGTGISVFQHFADTDQINALEPITEVEESEDNTASVPTSLPTKRLPRLPMSYTQMPPVTQSKLEWSVPKIDRSLKSECLLVSPAVQLEYR